MNRYYTPTIEEFHIGFEFESNYVLFNKTLGSDNWEKVTMTSEDFEWFPSAYKNDAYETEFRVKILDSTDIEELGFKYKWYENNETTYEKNDYIIQTYGNNIVHLYDKKQVLFKGVIKNKSELKALLKQMKIINE